MVRQYIVAATMEIPQKSMIQLLHFWVFIQRMWKDHVYCSIIYNSQDMEKTQGPIDGLIDKEDLVHIWNGILLNHKK